MKLFLYIDSDSFLHRLNPLTKLVFVGLVMLVLTLIVDPVTPLIVAFLLLLTMTVLGGVPVLALLRSLRLFLLAAFGLFWTTAFFYVPSAGTAVRILLHVGPVALSDQGAAYGAAITFRILAIFAASLLFTLTTDPTALLQALIQQWRLNHRFGYGVLAAYRFVPLFEGQLASIRAAHRVRGVPEGGGLGQRYRLLVGYLVPLLAGGVRQAGRVAIAMDARGFGAYPSRTFYRRTAFAGRDLAFAIGAVLVLGATLLGLHALGWLGQLMPPLLVGKGA
ncbi:MAG TPA: energy-coupling factor transporter transmembrane component T [Chloroflexota bacterium]|jgi:energy-coupling factor transport system permease protein